MRFLFTDFVRELLADLCSQQKLNVSSTTLTEISFLHWEKIKSQKYDGIKYGLKQKSFGTSTDQENIKLLAKDVITQYVDDHRLDILTQIKEQTAKNKDSISDAIETANNHLYNTRSPLFSISNDNIHKLRPLIGSPPQSFSYLNAKRKFESISDSEVEFLDEKKIKEEKSNGLELITSKNSEMENLVYSWLVFNEEERLFDCLECMKGTDKIKIDFSLFESAVKNSVSRLEDRLDVARYFQDKLLEHKEEFLEVNKSVRSQEKANSREKIEKYFQR